MHRIEEFGRAAHLGIIRPVFSNEKQIALNKYIKPVILIMIDVDDVDLHLCLQSSCGTDNYIGVMLFAFSGLFSSVDLHVVVPSKV